MFNAEWVYFTHNFQDILRFNDLCLNWFQHEFWYDLCLINSNMCSCGLINSSIISIRSPTRMKSDKVTNKLYAYGRVSIIIKYLILTS